MVLWSGLNAWEVSAGTCASSFDARRGEAAERLFFWLCEVEPKQGILGNSRYFRMCSYPDDPGQCSTPPIPFFAYGVCNVVAMDVLR